MYSFESLLKVFPEVKIAKLLKSGEEAKIKILKPFLALTTQKKISFEYARPEKCIKI